MLKDGTDFQRMTQHIVIVIVFFTRRIHFLSFFPQKTILKNLHNMRIIDERLFYPRHEIPKTGQETKKHRILPRQITVYDINPGMIVFLKNVQDKVVPLMVTSR